jgi:hypothetical protein
MLSQVLTQDSLLGHLPEDVQEDKYILRYHLSQ